MAIPQAQQIQQLIRNEITRLVRLVPSETIFVDTGDHPLQGTVRLQPAGGLDVGPGGIFVTGGGGGPATGPAAITLIAQTAPYVI